MTYYSYRGVTFFKHVTKDVKLTKLNKALYNDTSHGWQETQIIACRYTV